MSCVSHAGNEALAVSPLTSGRLGNPDIRLIYATPGQMITFINGLQNRHYKNTAFRAWKSARARILGVVH